MPVSASFCSTTRWNQRGSARSGFAKSVSATRSRMRASMRACSSIRDFGSLMLPITRNRMMPTNGMRKIASSQAMAAVGLRCRGMKMSASTLMARSTKKAIVQIRLPVSTAAPVDRATPVARHWMNASVLRRAPVTPVG